MKRMIPILSACALLLTACAGSVGVIGGADGPTTVVVSTVGEKADPDTLKPEEKLAIAQALAEDNAAVDTLYDSIGEPANKTYASSCLGDGEDGQLAYDGFTVYTYRDTDGNEAVQDVLES